MEKLKTILELLLPEAIKLNDFLAQHPEISGQEKNSSNAIVSYLRKHGCEVTIPYADEPYGFFTKIGSSNKKIALLAEYDALPEIGHACGHCASGTISALTFLILKELYPNPPIEIHLIGTPDEEQDGAKVRMAEKGVFKDYEYALMIHLNGRNQTYSPFVCLDCMSIEFFGKSAHASSSPWEGKNALNAVNLFFQAIDMMRQQTLPTSRIHGIITHGGIAANVIPDYTRAEVFTRDHSRVYLDDLTQWVKEAAQGAAQATRTKVKISKLCASYENISRNQAAEALFQSQFDALGLEVSEPSSMGSSDIGALDAYCPTFHPRLSVKDGLSLHTVEMAECMTNSFGHDAIKNGALILAGFIDDTLKNPDYIEKIKKDYEKEKKSQ